MNYNLDQEKISSKFNREKQCQEMEKILDQMKHKNSAIREDAYYKWIKLCEKDPKIVTDEERKKLLEALKQYS